MTTSKARVAKTLRVTAQIHAAWSDNHAYPLSAAVHEVILQASLQIDSGELAGTFSLLADQLDAMAKEARARANDAMRAKNPPLRVAEYERACGEAMDPTDNGSEDMG